MPEEIEIQPHYVFAWRGIVGKEQACAGHITSNYHVVFGLFLLIFNLEIPLIIINTLI